MTTATLAASVVVLLLLVTALAVNLVSVFLFLFSLAAILAANGLVPGDTGETLVLLAGCSLWTELAELERFTSGDPHGDSLGRTDLVMLAGALVGLIAGLGPWYLIGGLVPLALAGAFAGAMVAAVVNGLDGLSAARRALMLTERGPYGIVLKLVFCALVFVTLIE